MYIRFQAQTYLSPGTRLFIPILSSRVPLRDILYQGQDMSLCTADKKPVPEDKVTLTQSQFDRILETIGELSLLAEEKENTGTVEL